MLSDQQITRVDQAFAIYDHDWRFYREFLGEPFVIGDCLAYFDGSILYSCCFPLTDSWQCVSFAELQQSVAEFPHISAVRGFNAWGRLGPAESTFRAGHRMLDFQQFDESEATDLILDLEAFSFATVPSARLARNSARNKGLIAEVIKLDHLSWEHISLVELFFATHRVSTTHASFYLTLPSLMKLPNVLVVEGRRNSLLTGFAVISLPNKSTASLLMGFYDNASGSRVSDGVTAHAIDWAKKNSIKRLHFGYSSNDSLIDFKHKWGPLIAGPPFSELFFAADRAVTASFEAGSFPWRDRIYGIATTSAD